MSLIRLHNDGWGIETNCFACEARNEHGLQVPFFHDDERDVVVADFELGDTFSGAPTIVHGGIVLTVLDEAMAWACIAVAHRWAVTTETSARFHRPVRVGRRYRVEAAILLNHPDDGADGPDRAIRASAHISDERGTLRAEATATFTSLGEAQAVQLAGEAVPEEHRSYLRDG